jgi:hypothetical protein
LSDPKGNFVRGPIASNNPTRSPQQLNAPLTPLMRLLQIAEELRAAAQRNDLEVVRAAARLLYPTMEQCKLARAGMSTGAGDTAQAALHIQLVLDECETILTTTMRGVANDMKRIRQGKRSLAIAHSHRTVRPTRNLNPTR